MSDLAALGVAVKKRFVSSAGEEVDAATAELTELVFTLPKSTNVEATFAFEGLTARLVKIFKKEIQTGDGLFDTHVHIKTDTTPETTKLLESSDLRAIIEGIVSGGGAVEIDGALVKVQLPGQQELDANTTEHFVAALLA